MSTPAWIAALHRHLQLRSSNQAKYTQLPSTFRVIVLVVVLVQNGLAQVKSCASLAYRFACMRTHSHARVCQAEEEECVPKHSIFSHIVGLLRPISNMGKRPTSHLYLACGRMAPPPEKRRCMIVRVQSPHALIQNYLKII